MMEDFPYLSIQEKTQVVASLQKNSNYKLHLRIFDELNEKHASIISKHKEEPQALLEYL